MAGFEASAISAIAKTREILEWMEDSPVYSLESISSSDSSNDDNRSPVTDLASRFCSQNLDETPKRRLSLNTTSESDCSVTNSITTPLSRPPFLPSPEIVEEDDAHVEVDIMGIKFDEEFQVSDLCENRISDSRLSPLPRSGGFESDDTSPMISVSPAPSQGSVFLDAEEEDSRDSGISGMNKGEAMFREPERPAPKKLGFRSNSISKTLSFRRKTSEEFACYWETEECSSAVEASVSKGPKKGGGLKALEDLTNLRTLPINPLSVTKRALNLGKEKRETKSVSSPTSRKSGFLREDRKNRLKTFVTKRPISQSLSTSQRKTGLRLLESAGTVSRPSESESICGQKRLRNPSPMLSNEENVDTTHTYKKRKSSAEPLSEDFLRPPAPALKFNRCYSESVIQPGPHHGDYDQTDLIGNYTRGHSLPLVARPKIKDLKSISPETLAELVNDPSRNDYIVVDCRYGYEYEGGHVKGAIHCCWPDENKTSFEDTVVGRFFADPTKTHNSPIIIFYCEFSQKRGPRMFREVRRYDRKRNEYPKLCFPEMYLLDGGYKNFSEHHINLCDPPQYVPMLSKTHISELTKMRKLKSKSKSVSSFPDYLARGKASVNRGLFARAISTTDAPSSSPFDSPMAMS